MQSDWRRCVELIFENSSASHSDRQSLVQSLLSCTQDIHPKEVACFCAKYWGYDESSTECLALSRICDLAYDTMKHNPYHGPNHVTAVMISVVMLAEFTSGVRCLSSKDKFLLLLTAAGHDVFHDGGNNKGIRFRLEKIAVRAIQNVMSDYSEIFSPRDILDVGVLTLATEPTLRRSVILLSELAEKNITGIDPSSLNLPPEVATLSTDPRLALMAGYISDSDLFCSIGLGFEESVRQSDLIAKEEALYKGEEHYSELEYDKIVYFLHNIATDSFATTSGNQFISSLREIRSRYLNEPLDHGLKLKDSVTNETMSYFIRGMGIVPQVIGHIHPVVIQNINDTLSRFDSPYGGRIKAIISRPCGGLVALAEDARLDITRNGILIHSRSVEKTSRPLDDLARKIAAISFPVIEPIKSGDDVSHEFEHRFGKCQIMTSYGISIQDEDSEYQSTWSQSPDSFSSLSNGIDAITWQSRFTLL